MAVELPNTGTGEIKCERGAQLFRPRRWPYCIVLTGVGAGATSAYQISWALFIGRLFIAC
jgi:hypothetical protein